MAANFPQKHKDPLDTLVAVLAMVVILSVTVSVTLDTFIPYYVLAGLFALAWLRAPRRRYPTAEAVTKGVDLTGKVALVTGPTSGIGVETARVLALRGARVVLVARNNEKLQTTKALILASVPSATIDTIVADLSDLGSVQKAARQFLALDIALDLLILNAGIMALPTRCSTTQGFEKQVGTNHLGHFLLTRILQDKLLASHGRLVVLSSSAHRFADYSFLSEERLETQPYNEWVAYGNAKAANLMFANEFHRRYSEKHGVSAFSVMPGGIHTGLQGDVSLWIHFKWLIVTPFFFKSIQQGAATTLVAATTADPDVDGGKYFEDCKANNNAERAMKKAGGEEAFAKLWEDSERLVAEYLA